ncbi:MAG: hypothetical protein ACFNUD_05385, partial [Haemophilus parainfluenzae]
IMTVKKSHEISDNELFAITYFAVGAASEAKTRAYKLSLAGNEIKDSNGNIVRLEPSYNSGYSFSMMQNDLGQRKHTAPYLIHATQRWALNYQPNLTFENKEIDLFINKIARTGSEIRKDGKAPLPAKIKPAVNAFLASDEGIAFTHSYDVKQIARIKKMMLDPLRETSLYQNSSYEDKVRLITVSAKLFNQGEGYGKVLLKGIKHNVYQNLDAVYSKIDSFLSTKGNNDVLETGRKHALSGAEVIIALNAASPNNPLRQKWEHILENPLQPPSQRKGQERKDYDEVISLFFHSDRAIKTIQEKDKAVQSHSLNADEQTARHRSQPHPILAQLQEQAARYRHASEVMNSGDQAAINQVLNEFANPAAQQRLVEAEQRAAEEYAARERQQAEQAKAEQMKQQQEMADNEPTRQVAMIRR